MITRREIEGGWRGKSRVQPSRPGGMNRLPMPIEGNRPMVGKYGGRMGGVRAPAPTPVLISQNPLLGAFEKGGTVKKTGAYKLHAGEKVVPAKSDVTSHAYDFRKRQGGRKPKNG